MNGMQAKHMKSLLMIMASFLIRMPGANAQTEKPVKWAFTVTQVNSSEAELVFKAKIEKGFHVYSQDINPDVGPIPTTFTFQPGSEYSLAGKVTEGEPIEIYDPNFEVKLKYFSGEAVFVQKVKINGNKPFQVNGTVTFMVCDDRRCFPPEDLGFTFTVNGEGLNGEGKPASPGSVKNKQP